MGGILTGSGESRLRAIVANFEAAWIVRGEAELDEFVPEVDHPDRKAALIELIRVDLDQRRMAGRPRPPEDYLRAYSELGRDDLASIVSAGSLSGRPSIGLGPSSDPSSWQVAKPNNPWGDPEPTAWGVGEEPSARPSSFDATVSRKGTDLAGAARSYLDFWIANGEGDGGSLEAWAAANREAGDAATVDVLVDLHKSDPEAAGRLAQGVVSLPSVGETFLGFRLVGELGRGAFGRVFLASQGDLADRPVALKISAEKPTESQTLAQMQHTNIVPIFSAHQVDSLHAVCMPFFGSTTLKDIFEELEDQPSLPTSGRGLLETLASRRDDSSSSLGPWRPSSSTKLLTEDGPKSAAGLTEVASASASPAMPPSLSSDTLTMLGRLSYVGAVLWIGARLADGLAHAHGRGILHRDLKPANILLTDGGQPMLLDFNLSEDTKKPASAASIGGTLPYMAPEHLRAFRGADLAVDARSDIYALGIILHELLAGRHPFESYSGVSLAILDRMIAERSALPARIRERNPAVSPAVESIIRHCLEPDPARRYQTASDLREDLERQMVDLPLKHAPEPSAGERLGKWARRHPQLTSSTSVAILVGCVVLGVLGGFLARGRKLAELEALDSRNRLVAEAAEVRYRLNTRVHDRARRADAVARGQAALGRYATLDRPDWRERPLVASLGPDDRAALLEEVGALLLAMAGAEALDAQNLKPDDPARIGRLDESDRLCERALGCFADDRRPRALLEQRAEVAGLRGLVAESRRLRDEAAALPPRTALDHELMASALARRGEYRKARPLALEATRLDPRDFWGWFTLGLCQERVGQDAEAAASFGTCIALNPASPFGWFNRGVVHLRRGDYPAARLDLDRASGLDPNWPDPYSERAVAENLEGKPADAVRDYTRAIELGATDTRLYFLRSQARQKLGDAEGARLDREEGLRREPVDDLGHVARARVHYDADPATSLVHLEKALAVNPRSLDALQDKAYVLAEKLNKIAEAEAVLDLAVGFYPDFVPSRSARGVMRAILGRRDDALADARESLWRDTGPRILYQVAGIYAVTSRQVPEDKVEAYRLLSTALRQGFGFDELAEDRELDPIREQPEFRKLLEAARAIREAAPDADPRR